MVGDALRCVCVYENVLFAALHTKTIPATQEEMADQLFILFGNPPQFSVDVVAVHHDTGQMNKISST